MIPLHKFQGIYYFSQSCVFIHYRNFCCTIIYSDRLQEIERSSKELDSRAAIDRETLEILQSNLVAEKLNTQQLYTVLEKLGLGDNMLLSLPLDNLLKK